MKKKRILYIMGIDWEWIYQRPQILAEKLAADYEVTVVFPRSVITRNNKYPEVGGLEFRILWTLPYQEKNSVIGKLSGMINARIWKDINDFEYVFVGYPLYARYIPENYQGKIVYDCMDNHEALYPDRYRVERVVVQETQLIKKCDILVVSAELLKQKVDAIAGKAKSVLIRNGVKVRDISDVREPLWKQEYSICYIGTISEWFDYETLESSLMQMENINYQLIGPIVKQVDNSRIRYHGPIAHEKLGEAIREYDCLVMPFLVNEIVASVDPVKLYEYIAFGKCIISVYYPEIERFRDFVYFYDSKEEYVELLQELTEMGFPPKYNAECQRDFLARNTWDQRYEMLRGLIDGV